MTHDLDEAHYLGDSIVSLVRGSVSPDWPRRQYHLLDAMTARPPCPRAFPGGPQTPTMLRNAT